MVNTINIASLSQVPVIKCCCSSATEIQYNAQEGSWWTYSARHSQEVWHL